MYVSFLVWFSKGYSGMYSGCCAQYFHIVFVHAGQLCLMDKSWNPAGSADASSSAALSDATISKIDDCLAWIQQSKTSAKKVLENNTVGQGASLLKQNLKTKIQEILKFQMKMEEIKVIGSHDLRGVKTLLQSCSTSFL